MSLLREIQDAATSDSAGLAVVLRKCKILAARLANASLSDWIDHELNGYPRSEELPKYRILTAVESCGHLAGIGRSLEGAPIPPLCLPEQIREFVTIVYLTEGIASYEDLVRAGGDGTFQISWPADLTATVGRRIYRGMNCLSAWQVISRGAMVGLLDTVRNRVLNFALEIESAAPDAGESLSGKPALSNERVNQVFSTVILGGTNVITAGSSGTAVQMTVGVQTGDLASLVRHLSQFGVADEDTRDLIQAVEADPKPTGEDRFGPRISGWFGKMVSKAASGTWQVGSAVASDVLSRALLKYYGL